MGPGCVGAVHLPLDRLFAARSASCDLGGYFQLALSAHEKALPDMIEKSSEPQLKQGFQTHLQETKNHVKRLQQVFKLAGKEPSGVDCPAIDGIEEANEVAGEVEPKSVLDAALIAAAQAVEHYEMTRYGTLIAWAKELGHAECVPLLQQISMRRRQPIRS